MKRHLKFAGKCAVFICLLGLCIKLTDQVIVPKLFYQGMLAPTLSYANFYALKENTVDMLCLGSSIMSTSCIPQELYNQYGITSYNLGSEKQSPIISYFWLKEALRYQQPSVVVLDCYFFFDRGGGEVLNTSEISIRRALDNMRWSSVKREAVQTVCELDKNQSAVSYYFPNIRYHTRWMELTEDDFSYSDVIEQYKYMGYAPLSKSCNFSGYKPYDMEGLKMETDMHPLMREYLDKMCQLCKEKGIELILINIPVADADVGRFYTLQRYAEEQSLLFLDFNKEELYNELDFDFAIDSYDTAHLNLQGAKKISDYLGAVLVSQYNLGEKTDEQWENTRNAYEAMQKDCALPFIEDLDEYIEALRDDRYSVFISAGGYPVYLEDKTIQKMRELGLEMNIQTNPSEENFYYYLAVLSDGQIKEYIGYDEQTFSGCIRNGLVPYDITGNGSIIIDGIEESVNKEGINIVVYNNDERKVIDSVCFDILKEKNVVRR